MVAYLDQAGVQHLIAKIRNTFWPVGTILATSTNTSPASYIGGSWEAYAIGVELLRRYGANNILKYKAV